MPRYLDALRGPDLPNLLVGAVMNRHGELFNEPRTLLQTELREPGVYFSLLSALAAGPSALSAISSRVGLATREAHRYLTTLESLRLVSRHRPVGSALDSRSTQWSREDNFVRFWFRFVQPYQGELEAGAEPQHHVDSNVMPFLAEHTAPVFEQIVEQWLRRQHSDATGVGRWWGPALHPFRARKERFTEEIDAVVLRGKDVAVVAEAKWTATPLDAAVLAHLREYKLPALEQAGLRAASPAIVLVARSGFTPGLREVAAGDPHLQLVDATTVIGDLLRL